MRETERRIEQGCQMVYFRTRNSNSRIFLRPLEWKMLVHFMEVWKTYLPFGIHTVGMYIW
jgi:hypothetical protein